MNVTPRHLHAIQMPIVPTQLGHSHAHAEQAIQKTDQ